ncbi:hypothetical protein QUF58_01925 [Anaerolineales bacterium HSG24]|nr:hypothetical protein [Anaerolineales bacterium HSG24]
MSTEPTHKLLGQWKQHELELERAMGQVLQHIDRLDGDNDTGKISRTQLAQAVKEINRTLTKLSQDVEALKAHTNMPSRKKPGRSRSADSSSTD